MIVAVPHDVAEAPGAGQTSQRLGGLEERDVLAVLGELVGKRHPQEAAAHDAPPPLHVLIGSRPTG